MTGSIAKSLDRRRTTSDLLVTIAASGGLLAVGAVCWLATVAGDAAHGVLMFRSSAGTVSAAQSAIWPPGSPMPS
jgi:hypothetical protein